MQRYRLFDCIWQESVSDFAGFIQAVPNGESVQIDVMSYGGDAFGGLAIAEMLNEARKRGIHSTVVVYGVAASAAAIMAIAADHVVMTEIGSMMLHGVYHETWDGEIITEGDDIDNANAVCLSLIQRRCPDYTMQEFLAKDHWYTAQEAKDLGLIDEIRSLDDFLTDGEFKQSFRQLLNLAAHANRPDGGLKMSTIAKNDLDEKDVETQIEEQEKEVEKVEADGEESPAEEADLKSLIVDGFNAILDRLDAIEAALSAPAVEAEGDDEGDEKKDDDDIMAAKIRTMYDRIAKVSKPCIRPVKEDDKGDKKAKVKAAADRVKKLFPNIAKYYGE